MKESFTIEIEKDLHRPYYQKGHKHFLIYSLDGSITGPKAGFYIPPVIYLSDLHFYIRYRKLYDLHDYIVKTIVHGSRTEHYYEIPNLKLKIKITYIVIQEFTNLLIIIEPNKENYELIEDILTIYIPHYLKTHKLKNNQKNRFNASKIIIDEVSEEIKKDKDYAPKLLNIVSDIKGNIKLLKILAIFNF